MKAVVELLPRRYSKVILELDGDEIDMLLGVLTSHAKSETYECGSGLVGVVNSGCAATILEKIRGALDYGESLR